MSIRTTVQGFVVGSLLMQGWHVALQLFTSRQIACRYVAPSSHSQEVFLLHGFDLSFMFMNVLLVYFLCCSVSLTSFSLYQYEHYIRGMADIQCSGGGG